LNKIKTLIIALLLICGVAMVSTTPAQADTTVPGQTGRSGNVTGHYTSVYAYDDSGDYYWDLGDGRVYTSAGITSVDDLDQGTLTVCDYVINYRGNFGGDPYLDSGWIMNQINCHGFDDNGHYSYLIVHQSDPRYTGNPAWAVWGTWEYHVLVDGHNGNLVRPKHKV
jgi:hypothetical protein